MDDKRVPTPVDARDAEQSGAESAPPAFLTLNHVLTGMGAEWNPPIRLEVDAAESHYKRALMTREFGLNRN